MTFLIGEPVRIDAPDSIFDGETGHVESVLPSLRVVNVALDDGLIVPFKYSEVTHGE